MIHSGYSWVNPVIQETAGKMLEASGINKGKCVFLNSGSEAVEFSVQIAKSISDKPAMLTMKNCYLAAFGSAGKRDSHEWVEIDWMNNPDISEIDFSRIAGFVFEPGSSLGLVHFPPEDLVRKIVARVKAEGGTVICNEVTTGTGRTGKWRGFQHYRFVLILSLSEKALETDIP